MRKWHGGVWNGLLAAPPGHAAVQLLWDRLLDNMASRRHDNVWKATGPALYNAPELADNPREVLVRNQAALRGHFDLVNELGHKKRGQHWSERQKHIDIYGGTWPPVGAAAA